MNLSRSLRRLSRKARRRGGGGSGGNSQTRVIITLGFVAFIVCGILFHVHTTMIPIPILFKSFLLFDGDFNTFRSNLRRGDLGDLRSDFKSWTKGGLGDNHYTTWKQELLYNSAFYFTVAGGIVLLLLVVLWIGLRPGRRRGGSHPGGYRGGGPGHGRMGHSMHGGSGMHPSMGHSGSRRAVGQQQYGRGGHRGQRGHQATQMMQNPGQMPSSPHHPTMTGPNPGMSGSMPTAQHSRGGGRPTQRRLPEKLRPPPHYRQNPDQRGD